MPAKIPRPTGPFKVGCTDVTTEYGVNRNLFRLFYPAKPDQDQTEAIWLTDPRHAKGVMQFSGFGLFAWLFKCLYKDAKMPAYLDAPVDITAGDAKLPVLVFSHGLGANRTSYTNSCTEFASLGFLVVALEHADGSASATYYFEKNATTGADEKKWVDYVDEPPDDENPRLWKIRNKQVNKRAAECLGVMKYIRQINQGKFQPVECSIDFLPFKHKLDIERCAIVGHSFGAATVLTVLAQENDFKVAVAAGTWTYPLAESTYENLKPTPLLFVNSSTCHPPNNIREIMKLIAANEAAERRPFVTILGTVHQYASDFQLLTDWKVIPKLIALRGPSDPWAVSKLNNEMMAKFIGKHLNLGFGGEISHLVADSELLMNGTNVKLATANGK